MSYPARGSLNWDTSLQSYINLPQTGMTVYVDYANGVDTNNGFYPSYAYKTIQAAYDALKTYANANLSDAGKGLGVGTIVLLPGNHDVGSGLSFASNRPVKLVGDRKGSTIHRPSASAATLVSTSSAATEFVKMSHASAIGYGFVFEEVAFQPHQTTNSSLTKIIYASSIGNLTVNRCSFSTQDNSTNMSVCAVYHEDLPSSAGEAGWVKITNNNFSRFQMYKAQTTTGAAGGNYNYGQIIGNASFYGGSLPTIHLNADVNHMTVADNCLEGTATQIKIGSTGVFQTNYFFNNSGEDDSTGTPPNPFIDFAGSVSQQVIFLGKVTTPFASGAGTHVNFNSTSYRNFVLGVLERTAATTTEKRYISETSATDKNLIIPLNLTRPDYTVTNASTSRSLNVSTATTAQLAAVVGTMIADLQDAGFYV